MNGSASTVREILRRFRFEEPVPDGARAAMLKAKRRNLVIILKNAGAYGAIDGLIFLLYFAFERSGYRLSYRASRLLLSLFAAVTALLLVFAFVFSFNRIKPADVPEPRMEPAIEREKETGSVTPGSKDEKKQLPAVTPTAGAVRLGIRPFAAAGVDETDAREISEAFYGEIAAREGDESVVWYDDPGVKKNVAYLLVGTVSRIDDSFWVNIRLMNVESAELRHTEGAGADSIGELSGASKKIARRIAEKIK